MKTIFLGGMIALAISSSAEAATIGFSATDSGGGVIEFDSLLTLPLFDPSQGMLTGATLTYTAVASSGGDGVAGSGACAVDASVTVTGDFSPFAFMVRDTAASPGVACDPALEATAFLSDTLSVGPGDLDFLELVGTGTFALEVFGMFEPTNVVGFATGFFATAEITYRFDAVGPAPVPLPAGLPLLAAGMGLVGLTARRRR